MNNKFFVSVVWKEGEYFVAQCLNIDISSFGKTHEEALSNLQEALDLYLEDAVVDDVRNIEMPSLSIMDRGHFMHV